MSSTITAIKARQIFDSRGNPTVEVDVVTGQGSFRAAVPSGASTGIYEALELRDGGAAYMGKGVTKAVSNINEIIAPALVGKDAKDQKALDELMVQQLDGSHSENGWTKSKLGANAILGVSMAVARAGAAAFGLPLYSYIAQLAGRDASSAVTLPVPFFNVLNAGEHSGAPLVFQEFMVAPVGASSFAEAMQMGTEVYHNLKTLVKKRHGMGSVNVGDEGGFAPDLKDPVHACELLNEAIKAAGHEGKVKIAMDVAASEFCSEDKPATYDLGKKSNPNDGSGKRTGEQMLELYKELSTKYPVISIEDGFDQDDWEHWKAITGAIGKDVQIVGDDLTVTNPVRVKRAIEEKACNALLLKVNQIGSVTEAIEAVKLSQEAGWGIMASHRSGETEDVFIADLAVGLTTKQIKSGAPARSERLAKYNQLLRIEEELGSKAKYAGAGFRHF